MSVDDGRFMVGIMNVGDSPQPEMYLEFSKGLTQVELQSKISKLKQEGSGYSFNIAGYRQAGYEVSYVFPCCLFVMTKWYLLQFGETYN